MENKLYVGNLSYSMRDDTLRQQFAAFGQVASAKVMVERDIGSLVVMDHGRLAGLLTFREVLAALCKGGGTLVFDQGPLKIFRREALFQQLGCCKVGLRIVRGQRSRTTSSNCAPPIWGMRMSVTMTS